MRSVAVQVKDLYGRDIGPGRVNYDTKHPPQFVQSKDGRSFERNYTDHRAETAVYVEIDAPIVEMDCEQ